MKVKQKVASCSSRMQKNRGSLCESDRRAHISPKKCGVFGWQHSKNMGSLGDSSTENSGSSEPYIRVTSIMGVPLPPPRGVPHNKNYSVESGLHAKEIKMGTTAESLELRFRLILLFFFF